ncbi:MAG: hypothetical protein R3F23_04295, partial [Verrucomicrobiia bacterium]
MKKYDLYIANPVQILPVSGDLPFDPNLVSTRGLVALDMTLEESRAILRIVGNCRANAYLIPVEYRTPRISVNQARDIAMRRYQQVKGSGRELGQLDEGCDDFLWWTFRADDIKAIEEDRYPGQLIISVDKISGAIRSDKELLEWLQLSNL